MLTLARMVGMWDVLQKAVGNDNWQWPDSPDGVKSRFEDTLRSE